MRRLLRYFSVTLAAVTLLSSMTAFAEAPLETAPPPSRLENAPLIITGYYMQANMPRYVELYNSSSSAVQNIKDWTLTLTWARVAGATTAIPDPLTFALSGRDQYLAAKSYIVVSFEDSVPTASVQVATDFTADPTLYINQLTLSNVSYKPYQKTFMAAQTARMYLNETTTGYTTTGAYSADTRPSLYDNGLYEVGVSAPASFPLAPVEILANPRSCSPLETDTACREYIKFYNPTDETISFDGTRLRIGYLGQSGTTVPLGGAIRPGEYVVFDQTENGSPLSIANGGGYVWLEDALGIVTYQNTVTEYADATSSAHKGQSWAMIDGAWQWAVPSPGGANTTLPPQTNDATITSSLTPCKEGQYRNPETNRCRAIETSSSSLAPCDTDEYRSPETNRCRKVAASTSSLTPCREDQYRNPETNRCKSIAAASTELKPCAANQERNPETNRCRAVASSTMPKADYAVAGGSSSTHPTVGWLAFAFVSILAALYAVWEWRHEIATATRRFVRRFARQ